MRQVLVYLLDIPNELDEPEQNDVHHDTCCQRQLGRNDEFHLLQHVGYVRQLGRYPNFQQKSFVKFQVPRITHLVARFLGDGIWLAPVFCNGGMDTVYQVR